jgi:hypothetical protein
MGGAWRNILKDCAVPLTKLQSHVLRMLAAGRSLDSYIAGGVAINREGARFSGDIDIFQDSEGRLAAAAEADARALSEAGLKLTWGRIQSGKRQAEVVGLGETMQLEWVADSAFRFFPAQRDDLFGYVLHPVDLATNKAAAAADRREPRDIVDLVTIHENILPLGAVICAAVGRFPGQSPEEMLADITRHSRFTAEEFRVLATERPIDVPGLHRRIRSMLGDAERFISRIPSDAVGFVFLAGEKPVQPDVEALGKYQRRAGAPGGVWPSSPEISRAMLERYGKKQNGSDAKP